MKKNEEIIRIVDDEASQREALKFMLECEGYEVKDYCGALEFLTQDSPSIPGCVILDLKMPEMDGLSLQKELLNRNCTLPVVFLSAHGDMKKAVKAMKMGSYDFLEKPVDERLLLSTIAELLEEQRKKRRSGMEVQEAIELISMLTDREREIARLLDLGLMKKEIADTLNLKEKTVDNHCQAIYKKLRVHSVAELKNILYAAK